MKPTVPMWAFSDEDPLGALQDVLLPITDPAAPRAMKHFPPRSRRRSRDHPRRRPTSTPTASGVSHCSCWPRCWCQWSRNGPKRQCDGGTFRVLVLLLLATSATFAGYAAFHAAGIESKAAAVEDRAVPIMDGAWGLMALVQPLMCNGTAPLLPDLVTVRECEALLSAVRDGG